MILRIKYAFQNVICKVWTTLFQVKYVIVHLGKAAIHEGITMTAIWSFPDTCKRDGIHHISTLLAICEENSPLNGDFSIQGANDEEAFACPDVLWALIDNRALIDGYTTYPPSKCNVNNNADMNPIHILPKDGWAEWRTGKQRNDSKESPISAGIYIKWSKQKK